MLAMQGLVGAIGANAVLYDLTASMHHGEYASRRICIMSSSEGVWASLVFKQYNTQMDFMGREFLGWVGMGAAMSSRSSQHMVFRAIVACNMLHTLASISAPHPIYSCLFLQLLISMCATP